MKETPFTKFHIALGAKMVPFAGFNMPVQYEGLITEHVNVREKLGVFDVSHMGEVWVKGPKAFDFVQYVTTNDVAVLTDGKIQYSCFPNGKGGIVDDLLVYRIDSETYLLVINAANIEKDWAHLSAIAKEKGLEVGKELYNASDEIAQLAVQGPLALKAMQECTDTPVEDMEYYTFKKLTFAGCEVIFSTTGYTGAGGCEIYLANKDADTIWNAVMNAGEKYGLKPAGLGARDTLRLEMGFCLYGHEINDEISPIEAGLGWITKFTDGNNFLDRNRFEEQKANGVARKIAGFEMVDRGIPRQDYEVFDAEGNKIGTVCSGTQAPSLNKAVGTALIKAAFAKPDNEIYIGVRDKMLKAKVVKMPFYKK
ncbi:MAG: glycine cleavage system aminomethyltransferase GcvT [Bacteroidales bacterium]|nr:glycine cleavage system aminomethyltransferase GcvT [Bacteroidales bacterium]